MLREVCRLRRERRRLCRIDLLHWVGGGLGLGFCCGEGRRGFAGRLGFLQES